MQRLDWMFDDRKPVIDYPCPWTFQLIGRREDHLRAAVAEVIGTQAHTLTYSHTSSQGKYCSMRLELVVADEAQRLAIGGALHGHPDVRFVL
jgi:putative lipoic acid-binding regulatory protein